MFQTTEAYDAAKRTGKKPVLLAYLTGQKSRRVFGKLIPTEAETGSSTLKIWDGTYSTGDGGLFDGGGIPIFAREARVLQFGSLSETLTPERGDLIASLNQSELSAFQVVFDNTDGYFSDILGDDRDESFLTQQLDVVQTFMGLSIDDIQIIISGVVVKLQLTPKKLVLSCEPTFLTGIGQTIGSSGAQQLIVYVSQFGTTGSGNGEFDNPRGVILDGSNNMYVTDAGNDRVQIFDSSGSYLSQFGSTGSNDGEFNAPHSMVLDSSGNIYVTDRENHRVQKFDSSGSFLSKFGGAGAGNGKFDQPRGLTIDSSGNIWVVDGNNDRVEEFDSSGSYLSQFGSTGSNDGEFAAPRGIAIDSSGNIWVVDANNDRVQKFSSSGVYSSQFGSNGTGDGEFDTPRDIAFDTLGNIYITDGLNDRVQKFDTDGVYLKQFGTNGTGNGEFDSPRGLVVDQFFNIFVVDANSDRIQKFQ